MYVCVYVYVYVIYTNMYICALKLFIYGSYFSLAVVS